MTEKKGRLTLVQKITLLGVAASVIGGSAFLGPYYGRQRNDFEVERAYQRLDTTYQELLDAYQEGFPNYVSGKLSRVRLINGKNQVSPVDLIDVLASTRVYSFEIDRRIDPLVDDLDVEESRLNAQERFDRVRKFMFEQEKSRISGDFMNYNHKAVSGVITPFSTFTLPLIPGEEEQLRAYGVIRLSNGLSI